VRAQPGVGLLPHHRLVHHRDIRFDTEDFFGELDDADLIAGLIKEFCFHNRAYPLIIARP
jgi:hypothetical protein